MSRTQLAPQGKNVQSDRLSGGANVAKGAPPAAEVHSMLVSIPKSDNTAAIIEPNTQMPEWATLTTAGRTTTQLLCPLSALDDGVTAR